LAGYFFDSSALVKLYHPETGTPFVDQIVNTADNVVRVARLTIAELISAFAIKVRTQSISRDDADAFLHQFRADIATGKLEVFSIGEAEFAGAELLVEHYAFLASACLGRSSTRGGAGIAKSEVGGSFRRGGYDTL
jgi:predicted nucleic acid-binding protein